MQIVNENLEMAEVGQLVVHPRNPRRGDIEAIRRSIAANGFYGAIVAQRSSGHILAGNHRFQAALSEGARRVPVVWVDVDDQTALRILLADNRSSDLAHNDDEQLATLLREVLEDTGALIGTGYSNRELDQLLASLNQEAEEDVGDQTGELQSQFQILVTCDGEQQQAELLQRLTQEGLACRALVS